MIPPFGPDGSLPAGIHSAAWSEVVIRFGTTPVRRRLLAGLRAAMDALWITGCRILYLNGSFVTAKPNPLDYDACWEVGDVDPALLDPVLLPNRRLEAKAKYLGDLFPNLPMGSLGPTFLEFFMAGREDEGPKGIIRIDLEDGHDPE